MTLTGKEAHDLSMAPKLDYKAVGFRCGLEIHQQLDTRKLFSPCPSEVIDPDQVAARTIARIDRRLRATQSELGEVDVAALAEARKRKAFRYLAISGLTSLVETDEEPPHPMAQDALDVSLTFAGLIGAKPVAEVHVMRKTVIDGSNTSGFQRTALLGMGGKLDVQGGDVRVQTLTIEEDSARKVDDQDGLVTWTLDRLGIPLLEIATETDIHDPAHAQRTAARIGALLRATGRVKRGLGTIRQDVNVSVAVGDRVEVKGCQDLRAIPRIVEAEVRRQLWLHHVTEALHARKAQPGAIGAAVDATAEFAATGAKSVKDATAKGGKVLAVKLPGFAGLLKGASKDGPRLGRELSDHAKVAAGVKGIFHSDELPAYGISEAEVAAVRSRLACGADDAFALCVESAAVAKAALEAVAERARQAIAGPQKEVRAVQPDDSTRFMRPMPGAARMYPETDVPPIRITGQRWQRTLATLPPKPEERVAALVRQHNLSADLATQLLANEAEQEFASWASMADPALVARILLQYLPPLPNADRVRPQVPALLGALKAGRFSKEALEALLKALDADGKLDAEGAIAKLGVTTMDTATVDAVIAKVIAERRDFVKARGLAGMGALMGPVMAELRGKADGAVINARLKAAIEQVH
ncbi:MAG: Glu-tRNA(Gln) amidotransferase subunit GatE [Candidatus Thermoplasmatota archaeon]